MLAMRSTAGMPPIQNGVLVFAVDEARTLMKMQGVVARGVLNNYFQLLRRALELVNRIIEAKYSSDAGVFAILADTNSRISDFVPSAALDSLSRGERRREYDLFPPFVLTETTDIHSVRDGNMAMYRRMVTSTTLSDIEKDTWLDLVHMGRPIWTSMTQRAKNGQRQCSEEDIQKVIRFAASKLVSGADPEHGSSFSEETMFGVTPMLCRLGLQPNSSSPLAARTVADFMAVLSYVSYTHERNVSSYASDPMLTFDAARLWYEHRTVLANRILPQFRDLISQDAVDTGDIGVVVARILLLLAMDKCADVPRDSAIKLMTFQSVNDFFRVLRGPNVTLQSDPRDIGIYNALIELDDQWKNWKIGFNHFVQLEVEPSEECLWYMLCRRAAGVFPRDQEIGDLCVPIFTCDSEGQNAKVSAIFIHAKNGDFSVEESALKASVPRWSPSSGSASLYIPRDSVSGGIIHVVMNFNGNWKPRNYYGGSYDSHMTKISHVLRLEGIRHDSFVPEGVAEELDLLWVPWWTITEMVDEDLYRRKVEGKSCVLTEETIKQKIRCALSKHFLGAYQEARPTSKAPKAEINVKRQKVQEQAVASD